MRYAHYIRVKVFSYEKDNEDDKLILEKLLSLIPFDIAKEKIKFGRTDTRGFNEKKIAIFEILLEKEKHTGKFLENLAKNLDIHQKNRILDQIESRLDDNLSFFLRFDKKDYMDGSRLVLTDSGNCFHIEVGVAAFPRKREAAIEAVKKIFNRN